MTPAGRLRRLQDEFVEKFLVRVSSDEGVLDLGELDLRFFRFWERLEAEMLPDPDVRALVYSLQPDPISGVSEAVHQRLLSMQPGRVRIPNPVYREALVFKGVPKTDLLDSLPQGFQSSLDSALASWAG